MVDAQMNRELCGECSGIEGAQGNLSHSAFG